MEPIAITGFSFKLAQGAEDDASFWEILEKGRNVMTPYPQSRAKHIDAFCEANGTAQNVVCILCNLFRCEPSSEADQREAAVPRRSFPECRPCRI